MELIFKGAEPFFLCMKKVSTHSVTQEKYSYENMSHDI